MNERNKIAEELWAAFKHWDGERKYALRQIIKHLTGDDDMSSWRYQIMRHRADTGETYLAVHEFYVAHDKKEGWTQKPITIEADTLPELRMNLLNMLRDLERHGVRDVETGGIVQTGAVGQM